MNLIPFRKATPPISQTELDMLLATFDWDAWNEQLKTMLEAHAVETAIDQAHAAADQLRFQFNEADPFVTQHFTSYLGQRITQLDDHTREVVVAELHKTLEAGQGLSVQELAGRLVEVTKDSAAFSPSRALTIARTETATATNVGALLSYRQYGVTHVDVSDGDQCDQGCAEANGAVWSLEQALAAPLQHPNCTRSFGPHIV